MKYFLLLTLLLISLSSCTHASTYYWWGQSQNYNNPGSGDFVTGSDWTINKVNTPVVVPSSSDIAIIGGESTVNTPGMNINVSINEQETVNVGEIDVESGSNYQASIQNFGQLTVGDQLSGNGSYFQESQYNSYVGFLDGPGVNISQGSLYIVGDEPNFTDFIEISPGSQLNLSSPSLLDTSDSESTIRSYLLGGYSGGRWNGNGIASMNIAQSSLHGYGLGYQETTNGLIIERALYGDTNLDGSVNLTDLINLLNHYGQTGTMDWNAGDFNYDGTVNLTDLLTLLSNYGQSGGVGSTVSIPEPTCLGLIGVFAYSTMGRRRQ